MTTKIFKPGDKVICIDNQYAPTLTLGRIYTVREYKPDRWYGNGGEVSLVELTPIGAFYAKRFNLVTDAPQVQEAEVKPAVEPIGYLINNKDKVSLSFKPTKDEAIQFAKQILKGLPLTAQEQSTYTIHPVMPSVCTVKYVPASFEVIDT